MICLARGAVHWLFAFSPLSSSCLWRGGRLAPHDHLASQLARAGPRVVRDHSGLCCIIVFWLVLPGPCVLDDAAVVPIHELVGIRVTDLDYWQ